jgi:hypothetical protein
LVLPWWRPTASDLCRVLPPNVSCLWHQWVPTITGVDDWSPSLVLRAGDSEAKVVARFFSS